MARLPQMPLLDGMWSEDYDPRMDLGAIRHRRAPRPLHFPWSEKVPESKRHVQLRTFLFEILRLEWADRACIGCDQFVYWNAADPKRNLAPDGFVRVGEPDFDFRSWKTWENGTPHLAIEISDREVRPDNLDEKLGKYHELGVRELIWFDPLKEAGLRLRAWDRIDDDFVERDLDSDVTPCSVLGVHWVVSQHGRLGLTLRPSRDAAGNDLLPAAEDIARRELEEAIRASRAAAAARDDEIRRREELEQRVAELQEQLRKRG